MQTDERAFLRGVLQAAANDLRDSKTLPVDVAAIAARLGIEIRRSRDRAQHGHAMLELGASPTIWLDDEGTDSRRARFSIAHEIGHWVVWRQHGKIPGPGSEYWFHESLCNEFAARLLLPAEAVESVVENLCSLGTGATYLPAKVAAAAHVSWEAAARAIAEMPRLGLSYLRLRETSPGPAGRGGGMFVDGSAFFEKDGFWVGGGAHLRDPALIETLRGMVEGSELEAVVTARFGRLSFEALPTTLGRTRDRWMICARPTPSGLKFESKRKSGGGSLAQAPRR